MDSQPNLYNRLISRKMQKVPELNKQIIKFTIIGGLAVLADLTFYFLFLNIFPEKIFTFISNEAGAKTLSFMCGIFVTYNLNKYWTWKKRGRSGKSFFKFIILYGSSMAINVTLNSVLLFILHRFPGLQIIPNKYLIAFAGATVISSLFNFVGQKFWVFKSS